MASAKIPNSHFKLLTLPEMFILKNNVKSISVNRLILTLFSEKQRVFVYLPNWIKFHYLIITSLILKDDRHSISSLSLSVVRWILSNHCFFYFWVPKNLSISVFLFPLKCWKKVGNSLIIFSLPTIIPI